MHKALLLFHTVRYLRFPQIIARFRFRMHKPKPDLRPAPPLRKNANWTDHIVKPVCLSKPWNFSFLNEVQQCRFPGDWNRDNIGKLWLYNLHYFDDLCCHAAVERKEWHKQYILEWLQDNPPGYGNGWEPYPLSLRIVNWIKWAMAGNEVNDMFHSLAVQTRFLCMRLEYHLLGNHLFANGKALLFAGVFFSGEEAVKWRNTGLKILEKEILEQILDDGGHFERSPMYHAIIFEDLLDLINIMRAFGFEVPVEWLSAAQKMGNWLEGMTHPDGDIVLFNDAALDIAARPEELFAYCRRLKLPTPRKKQAGLSHFPETGYITWEQEDATAFLDVAPIGPDYLPGHGHADSLHFELSLFGSRIIVDSGTSCYGISAERLRQRGTAAHNTVMIDGENSSEVWSGFRVARRAKPFGLKVLSDEKSATVFCCHDGYHRLPGRPTHCRRWQFDERNILITDTITGRYTEAIGRIHFHPDVAIRMDENGISGILTVKSGQEVQWKVTGGSVRLILSSYHPEFGVSLPGQCMETLFTLDECSFRMWW